MTDKQNVNVGQAEAARSITPTWQLVFKYEFSELWVGGRVLNLLILFSVLMSIMAFLLATNNELSLIPPRQMMVVTLQATMTFGLFIGLIIAAESISGERERATLEALLLTSASRRQIVVGKFLAALSPWPAALLLSIPYITVLSQGDQALAQALLWGGLMGSILAVAFTGFGMLMSIWSNSNRISLFVSLLVYLLSLLPAQLPGQIQAAPVLTFIQVIDPLEATNQFLQKILLEGRPLDEAWIFLVGCVVVIAIILGLLFLYAAPRLRLEGGRAGMIRPIWRRMEAIK